MFSNKFELSKINWQKLFYFSIKYDDYKLFEELIRLSNESNEMELNQQERKLTMSRRSTWNTLKAPLPIRFDIVSRCRTVFDNEYEDDDDDDIDMQEIYKNLNRLASTSGTGGNVNINISGENHDQSFGRAVSLNIPFGSRVFGVNGINGMNGINGVNGTNGSSGYDSASNGSDIIGSGSELDPSRLGTSGINTPDFANSDIDTDFETDNTINTTMNTTMNTTLNTMDGNDTTVDQTNRDRVERGGHVHAHVPVVNDMSVDNFENEIGSVSYNTYTNNNHRNIILNINHNFNIELKKPIFIASENDSGRVIKSILKICSRLHLRSSQCINTSNNDGYTPLYIACKLGNVNAALELLKNRKSNILFKPEKTKTSILMITCKGKSIEIFSEILSIIRNNPNNNKEFGEKRLKKELLRTNRNGDTVLHFASRYNAYKIVNLLVVNYRDHIRLDKKNRAKKTAKEIAIESKHEKTLEAFQLVNSFENY